MKKNLFDVVVLTDPRYVNPHTITPYIQNVLDEDQLVVDALSELGLKVTRLSWDQKDMDWNETRSILFRTTWDYFDRIDEFTQWLHQVKYNTHLINPEKLIFWNMDKHYLLDLQSLGVNIPPTLFIEKGETRSFREIIASTSWDEFILKPAIAGAARHTYRIHPDNMDAHEAVFKQLIKQESMLIQEFQVHVIPEGEIAMMCFSGQFTHAILKKAKEGDFRVQDDFGGSVHKYQASDEEIAFAENVAKLCDPIPVYSRVDIFKDNQNNLCVSELELIEPELWFRFHPMAAKTLAKTFLHFFHSL